MQISLLLMLHLQTDTLVMYSDFQVFLEIVDVKDAAVNESETLYVSFLCNVMIGIIGL